MPKVTIILPVYNSESYLKETIESALSQSFTDFELVIINDGSQDRSEEIVHSFSDDRIRYFKQENKGHCYTRHRAIEEGSGAYIAILDADDLWVPEKLEWQVDFLDQHPNHVLVGGEIDIIDGDGNYMYSVHKPHSDAENRTYLEVKNMWTHSSVMYRRGSYYKVGGYFISRSAYYFEDYMLMYQLSKIGKIAQLKETIASYRINPNAISSKTESAEYLEIMRRSLQKGEVSQQDLLRLEELKKNDATTESRRSYYHLFLGRSYMFHNYQCRRSIKHLKKAVKYNKDLRIAWIYLQMVRFLPKPILKFIYRQKKKEMADMIWVRT